MTMTRAALFLILASLLAAQHVPTGPGIGERAPSFETADQNGAARSLESLMGPKGLVLVFYRSADW